MKMALLVGLVIGWGGGAWAQADVQQDDRAGQVLDWASVVAFEPDPAVVVDEDARRRISESGLPWRVMHQQSGVEFLLVPGGEYQRGAAGDDPHDRQNERPQHNVTISKAFYLSRTEVTNAQMRKFRGSHDSGTWYRDTSYSMNGDELPAVDVSWLDASAFCTHFGFRLPSEGEWEYAARAGVQTRYPWGNDFRDGASYGNIFDVKTKQVMEGMDWECFPFDDGVRVTTAPGTYEPNAWGFVDMYGNVWEWCEDVFKDETYQKHADGAVDPLEKPITGRGAPLTRLRPLRGGGFGNAPRGAGLAYRWGADESNQHDANGFRVARTP